MYPLDRYQIICERCDDFVGTEGSKRAAFDRAAKHGRRCPTGSVTVFDAMARVLAAQEWSVGNDGHATTTKWRKT